MSNFVGKPPFSNSLWVAIETMHFHIAHTKKNFEDTFVSHSGGPKNDLTLLNILGESPSSEIGGFLSSQW